MEDDVKDLFRKCLPRIDAVFAQPDAIAACSELYRQIEEDKLTPEEAAIVRSATVGKRYGMGPEQLKKYMEDNSQSFQPYYDRLREIRSVMAKHGRVPMIPIQNDPVFFFDGAGETKQTVTGKLGPLTNGSAPDNPRFEIILDPGWLCRHKIVVERYHLCWEEEKQAWCALAAVVYKDGVESGPTVEKE